MTTTAIKVEELRIGNWIYNTKGKPSKINEIKRHPSGERDFAHIVTLQGLGSFGGYVEDLQPIPLTPEILEKCGLERDTVTKTEVYRFPKLSLMRGLDNEYRFFDIKSAPIKYLHQLQNLYFALTGTELQISL
jgi:hypothetical protein